MDASNANILITRLSHIGDCILTIPVVRALKAKYPGCRITWAVESPSHKLLATVSEIDELFIVPKNWMSRLSNWKELRRKLKSGRFDIAIDPQGITKSSMLGWLSGARVRVGARGKWGRELSTWLNNSLVEPTSNHLVDRSLELLSLVEIQTPSSPSLNLPRCVEADASMKRSLNDIAIDQFVVINPGASWPSKRWETKRFGDVAQHIYETTNVPSLITWAGDEELEMAQSIVENAKSGAILAPPTSLPELAALCSQAKFFVGCDTGPLHIAAAVGTPCVGLYGPTRPGDSGAYGSAHIHVQKWYQSGTSRERRSAENEAMRDISVGDVNQAIDRMVHQLTRTQAA